MPQTYLGFVSVSFLLGCYFDKGHEKVHPSPTVIKVLALGAVVETLLHAVFRAKESTPWLQAKDRVSLGRWHQALTGELEVRIRQTA